ncbi:Eye-specific diacylglycerol kinase-like Protein [Tribolium castaneum]|uniref:Diacylglycerol kinase n=1 Tax=Tribolium castaneum TaxID=7070 RepID=A0A139WF51_TRICA|nr:Eye-specific diacylglycerol kinase-like Protein [Tribolium castaneum]
MNFHSGCVPKAAIIPPFVLILSKASARPECLEKAVICKGNKFPSCAELRVEESQLLHGSGKVLIKYGFGDIDYDGFRKFLDTFLEVTTPEELCRHLFLSFVRKGVKVEGKAFKEMAVLSSTTACAPITSHNKGSTPNVNSIGEPIETKSQLSSEKPTTYGEMLVEKIHGFGEKLLGHHRSDSDCSTRGKTGTVHPMLTVTHTSYSCHEVLGKKSTDSSPSHSQISRNSSKKSNNSLLVNNGKLEEVRHIVRKASTLDVNTVKVSLKDIVCYLSLLEAGRPEDKLEFMFRLYDTDGNGVLDTNEMDCIVNQMMTVAEYLGWDVSRTQTYPAGHDGGDRLRRRRDCLAGGVEKGRFDHHPPIGAPGAGYECERRREPFMEVEAFQQTGVLQPLLEYVGRVGQERVVLHVLLHNKCVAQVKAECGLGEHAVHILPPTAICPIVLDRQRSLQKRGSKYGHDNVGYPDFDPYSRSKTDVFQGNFANTTNKQPAMSFQITTSPNSVPLLVFINPKSGGRQGARILRKFQYILNPRQVHSLASGGPMQGLSMFKDVPNFKVVCCGGDGTVGWVLETMDKVELECQPAVAVIPLGTGNDLARCLRWGGGYEGESIHKILHKIARATTVLLDRWLIELSDTAQPDPDQKIADTRIPYNIINNYFSIGVDAAICVKFHLEREKNPEKFNSRMKNKLWYFEYATSEQFAASCKNLHEDIEITCDDVSLDLANGSPLQGIALLNIPYTHGGSNLWGEHLSGSRRKSKKKKKQKEMSTSSFNSVDLSVAVQDIGDGLIEVIGLENCLHMGQVRTGLRASGRRLAQCSSVVIKTKKTFPMQIDGEPWMQPPTTIRITHKNQVPMLMAPPPEKGKGFFRFFKR